MYDQLLHLAKVRANIQVLPIEAETYLHLDGSFAIATLDGSSVGYVDTPAKGVLISDSELVSRLRRRWEAIVAEALPRGQSRDLIVKVAEIWTQ